MFLIVYDNEFSVTASVTKELLWACEVDMLQLINMTTLEIYKEGQWRKLRVEQEG